MFTTSFFMAAAPLVVMVLLIVAARMPVHKAVLVTLAIVAGVCAFYFKTPAETLLNATLFGVVKGLWPIAIVIFAAIFAYNLMQKTGAVAVIRGLLSRVSDDERILMLLIAWCFGGFLEAAAGFSTAVAIPLGILIALGFDPVRAAVATLVADTTATVFGAVGIPVTVAGDMLGLPITGGSGVSFLVVGQLALLNILIPFLLVVITTGSVKAVRGVFGLTLAVGVMTLVPQFAVAWFVGPELTAFAGPMVSLAGLLLLARRRNVPTPEAYRVKGSVDGAVKESGEAGEGSAMGVMRAVSIYALMFIFILASSPLFPSVSHALSSVSTTFSFPVSETRTLNASIAWIATPGMLIIFATLAGGMLFQGAKPSLVATTFVSTLRQLTNAAVAIAAIVAMATIMDVTGLIGVVAEPLLAAAGPHYPFLAPVIGAVGTFVTGSVTNANVLFGRLQTIAAANLHVDPAWLVAANAAGATATKMIAPQSITIAVGASGMTGLDAKLMKGTAPWALLYLGVVVLVVGLATPWFTA